MEPFRRVQHTSGMHYSLGCSCHHDQALDPSILREAPSTRVTQADVYSLHQRSWPPSLTLNASTAPDSTLPTLSIFQANQRETDEQSTIFPHPSFRFDSPQTAGPVPLETTASIPQVGTWAFDTLERPAAIRRAGQPRLSPEGIQQEVRRQFRPIMQKRPNRCIQCKIDPGKRSCSNHPLCNICRSRSSHHVLTNTWTNEYFLDWHTWLQLLRTALDDSASIEIEVSPTDDEFNIEPGPIRLAFHFHDRKLSGDLAAHVVEFRPAEQAGFDQARAGEGQVHRRPPALILEQLDHLVQAGVWGDSLWNDHKANMSPDDGAFWSTIQLFAGYFCMTHRLRYTTVESSDFATQTLQKLIAAELIYTFGWQLSRLYFEISQQCQRLMESEEPLLTPATVLYGLEVLCRLMKSMRQTNWALDHLPERHALRQLQDNFNSRARHILERLLSIECCLSGKYTRNRQWRYVPSFVHFARNFPDKRDFPSRCIIMTVAAETPSVDGPRPVLETRLKRRVLDVLGNSENSLVDLLDMEHNCFLTEDNRRVEFDASETPPSDFEPAHKKLKFSECL